MESLLKESELGGLTSVVTEGIEALRHQVAGIGKFAGSDSLPNCGVFAWVCEVSVCLPHARTIPQAASLIGGVRRRVPYQFSQFVVAVKCSHIAEAYSLP